MTCRFLQQFRGKEFKVTDQAQSGDSSHQRALDISTVWLVSTCYFHPSIILVLTVSQGSARAYLYKQGTHRAHVEASQSLGTHTIHAES